MFVPGLPVLLCLVSAIHSATGVWAESCKTQSAAKTKVENWPLTVAIKTADLPGASSCLSLLGSRGLPVANLTFTYSSAMNGLLLMEMDMWSPQSSPSTAVLIVAPNTWHTLVLDKQKSSKLAFSLETQMERATYSVNTSFDVNVEDVASVNAFCIRTCAVDVDFECLSDTSGKASPSRVTPPTKYHQTEDVSTILWASLVLFVFMVMAGVLYVAWRHQHKKVKVQAHAIATRKRNTTAVTSNGVEAGQRPTATGLITQPTLQYSTMLMSYDGPYSGSDEEVPPQTGCSGARSKTRNDYLRNA